MTVRHENKDRLFLFMCLQRPTSFLFCLYCTYFYTESKANHVLCKIHITPYGLCGIYISPVESRPPTQKLHNVTLTLILNLHLIEQDPSVSCLPIFAGTKLLLIINSGAAVLKYMTYLLGYQTLVILPLLPLLISAPWLQSRPNNGFSL